VLTFNVQNDEGDPRRTALINRLLRHLAPDIVALQEVRYPVQLGQLLAGTGLTATHQSELLPQSPTPYGGTAVATKGAHTVQKVVESAPDEPFHWWTLAVSTADGLTVVVPTTPWEPAAAATRERQARAVGATGRTIVAGDLNATPGTASVSLFRNSFRDVWEHAGDGPGDTWTAENPLVTAAAPTGRIDYIFVSPDIEVVSARRVGTRPENGVWLSDHYGVVADLEVRA
jgi:endonuclease/exonuclease/phosphatase family metal-dependent hydrolase